MSTAIAMKDVMDLDKKGKPSDLGYLVYQNNTLEFYKYKALGGSYQVFIYIVVSIIRLFLKEKLIHTITKDQIASISIERGQDIITQGGNTGRFLRAFSSMTGQNSKGPDTLIVTMKNNETYKFIVSPQTDEAANQISFDNLVVNMGMMLS